MHLISICRIVTAAGIDVDGNHHRTIIDNVIAAAGVEVDSDRSSL